MSRYAARLAKLEGVIPLQVLREEQHPGEGLSAIITRIQADTARVAALPPKQKIAYHLEYIAAQYLKAAVLPIPHRIPELAEQFHAFLQKVVKDDFPIRRHEIRGCELELLLQAGYDTTELRARHRKCSTFQHQWRHLDEALPSEAQALIDSELFDA